MIANETLRVVMTAFLLAAALYATLRAARNPAPAMRVDYGLHAVMMIAMVPMLVPGSRWLVLPQLLLFVLATWWFVIRATYVRPANSPPVIRSGRPARAGRSLPLYNALTMAAMAYMLAAMDFQGAMGPEAAGAMARATHHGPVVAGLPLPGPEQDWSTLPAPLLAAAFGLAGVVWAVQLLRGLRAQSADRGGDAFVEAVGAASMAVMFAGLAA